MKALALVTARSRRISVEAALVLDHEPSRMAHASVRGELSKREKVALPFLARPSPDSTGPRGPGSEFSSVKRL